MLTHYPITCPKRQLPRTLCEIVAEYVVKKRIYKLSIVII